MNTQGLLGSSGPGSATKPTPSAAAIAFGPALVIYTAGHIPVIFAGLLMPGPGPDDVIH